MTAGATERTRAAARTPRLSARPTEAWQHTLAARQQVAALLHALPAGYVVFADLELPKPSRATIDHLVIGPRGVWSITTDVFAEPIAEGRGRNADTLWAGRTPLRALLEAADWESTAISELIGHPVEPLVCLVAPSLPRPAFDFHGIRICQPETLTKQVAVSTADFVDITVIADAARGVFDAEPATDAALPKLGAAVLAPQLRPGAPPRRRRTFGARLHALRSKTFVRASAVAAVAAAVVAFFPSIVNVWNSVAAEGAARITDVIDESSSDDAPLPVGYTISCTTPGSGWTVEWSWPGELPDGVAGYGIRTERDGEPALVHTVVTWSDLSTPPPPIRLVDPAATTIMTDHRAPDGSTVASSAERIVGPVGSC